MLGSETSMLASHVVINADFFSETHRLSCRLQVGPSGLLRLLNDANSSLLEVENAYVSRIQQPAKIINHFDKVSLNKANLAFAIVNRREDLGVAAVTQSAYSRLVNVSVEALTATYEITGQVEVANKLDAGSLLVGGTSKFVPFYKATAVPTLYPDATFTGEVIVINRTLVEALAAVGAKGKA